jgi:alkylation response protein AidB-like acyl-CoA dehydrogenase/predicted heme/steroid binding protein
MAAMKTFTLDELAKHNTRDDLWVAIGGAVYDLSGMFAKFLHPGGAPPLLEVAGTECTEEFFALHRLEVLQRPRFAKLQIGVLTGGKNRTGEDEISPVVAPVPYAESLGFWRKSSPYYTKSHDEFRSACRAVYDEHVAPNAEEWDEDGKPASPELYKALGDAGIIATLIAGEGRGADCLERWGVKLPGGLVSAREFDYFHGLIGGEEAIRGVRGGYGLKDGLIGGISIGVVPIIKYGSEHLIEKFAKPTILGDKRFALAISEPYAGSDVNAIHTTATMHEDGNWRVSGVKKWITGGMMADYFTVLCRTAEHGFCMFLVERPEDADGLTFQTKPIKTSYSAAAGTALVIMDEVVVPPENLIGKPGQGFYQTMGNFNIERWQMVVGGNRHSRMIVEECMKWAMQRKVFGKPLIQQPVIRFKLGQMIADVESVHSMLEVGHILYARGRSYPHSIEWTPCHIQDMTYQMCTMTEGELNVHLAGPISLLKYDTISVHCNVLPSRGSNPS